MRFLLDVDRDRRLLFAPLQGITGSEVTKRHSLPLEALSSVVYVRNYGTERELVYERSDAAIAILEDLGGFWRILSFVRFLPRELRDTIYDFVARNRYAWFGKLEECRLPEPHERERFLS